MPKIINKEKFKRMQRFIKKIYGNKCMGCGTTKDPIAMSQIRPLSRFPEHYCKLYNCQLTCPQCEIARGEACKSYMSDEHIKIYHIYEDLRIQQRREKRARAKERPLEPKQFPFLSLAKRNKIFSQKYKAAKRKDARAFIRTIKELNRKDKIKAILSKS